LAAIYIADFFIALGAGLFEPILGLIRVVTGLWLMYLMSAVTLNFAAGFHLTV
jgi:hypothetical protein